MIYFSDMGQCQDDIGLTLAEDRWKRRVATPLDIPLPANNDNVDSSFPVSSPVIPVEGAPHTLSTSPATLADTNDYLNLELSLSW